MISDFFFKVRCNIAAIQIMMIGQKDRSCQEIMIGEKDRVSKGSILSINIYMYMFVYLLVHLSTFIFLHVNS